MLRNLQSPLASVYPDHPWDASRFPASSTRPEEDEEPSEIQQHQQQQQQQQRQQQQISVSIAQRANTEKSQRLLYRVVRELFSPHQVAIHFNYTHPGRFLT